MSTGAARPRVTVAVAAGPGSGSLADTLRSLSEQTLPADRFEVVVVAQPGFRRAAAALTLRWLCAATPLPRTAALAMARAEFTTFLDAGDTVSPGYVQALLDRAGSSVLGLALVLRAGVPGVRDLEVWAQLAGTVTAEPASEVMRVALRTAVGTMVPTELARAVRCAGDVTGDVADDTLFLAELISRFGLAVSCCSLTDDAVCFRAERPLPDAEHLRGTADDLAAVERLTAAASLTPELAGRAVDARLDAINLRLQRSPGMHAATVELVRAHPRAPLDWSRLNRDVARDLAVVYAALPYVDTSGNIAARRVRALGRPVDVVCADMSRHAGVDPSASALWDEYLGDRHEVGGPATMHGDWTPIARFCREGAEVIALAERTKGRYRSVYTRTMFPAAHLLGALYKHRNSNTPWLAEFSDPQLRDSRGGTRTGRGEPDDTLLDELATALRARGFTPPEGSNVWEWAELVAYALADTVMFTNGNQLEYMLGYCRDRGHGAYADRAAARAVVVPHPRPPAALYRAAAVDAEFDPALVHIGYFGTFYATRTLTEVVSALRELDGATRARLRLHVFTKKPDAIAAEAAAAGLGDVIVAAGYLDFTHYLAMTTRLDVLLVNDYDTRDAHTLNPYLPAKYADYAGSGRPVWGVVEPGSVLSAEPLALRSELGDPASARRALEQIASRRLGRLDVGA